MSWNRIQPPAISTVELQWLEHLWDHENLFETGVVRAIEVSLYRQVRMHNRVYYGFSSI